MLFTFRIAESNFAADSTLFTIAYPTATMPTAAPVLAAVPSIVIAPAERPDERTIEASAAVADALLFFIAASN
jgi:hypothetical protein